MKGTSGTTDPRFAQFREALVNQPASGEEPGASIAVDVMRLVDVRAGHRHPGLRQPWTADTLVNVWSTTNTVTDLVALVLVERGLLDRQAPVAPRWPEFVDHGKEVVEVRLVPAYTSGVTGWGRVVMDRDRPASSSYILNRMGSGIVGSDRAGSYLRVLQTCLA